MKPYIRFWIIGLLALAALAGGVGLVSGIHTPAAPVAQETPVVEDPHIQQLRQLLNSENLSEEGRSSLQEKLEIAERLAAQQAAGKAAGSAKSSGAGKDPGAVASFLQPPAQDLVEGIFEGSQGLVRPSLADIANLWQGQWDGTVYQVFAGSTAEESPHALVIVVTLDPDLPTGKQDLYVSPEASTRLRILEAQGQRLLLEDENGSRIFFDLASRTFEH